MTDDNVYIQVYLYLPHRLDLYELGTIWDTQPKPQSTIG